MYFGPNIVIWLSLLYCVILSLRLLQTVLRDLVGPCLELGRPRLVGFSFSSSFSRGAVCPRRTPGCLRTRCCFFFVSSIFVAFMQNIENNSRQFFWEDIHPHTPTPSHPTPSHPHTLTPPHPSQKPASIFSHQPTCASPVPLHNGSQQIMVPHTS